VTDSLMVVHRRHDEAPAFAEGFYVIGPNGEVVAGPFEGADEAEEAARQGRVAVHYRETVRSG
jgi:hypothetical protein